MKICIKLFVLVLAFFLNSGILRCQCNSRLTHTVGTKIVEGIGVTVTSQGFVSADTSFYCIDTRPYFIGATPFGGNGSYTFSFYPAVSSATLNFAALGNEVGYAEEVQIYKDQMHYPVSTVGSPNGCDSLAILTTSGNIRACIGCGLAGWKGTIVNGPINILTVVDTLLAGNPGGVFFSISICGNPVGITEHLKQTSTHKFSPNPFSEETLLSTKGLYKAKVLLYDYRAVLVKELVSLDGTDIVLSHNEIGTGFYYYLLISGREVIRTGRLIAE